MKEWVVLRGVSAGYDRQPVLREVDLTIREGDFLGVIGPNGGGKTTLLKVILGLLSPMQGEVFYPEKGHSLFGYLPQYNAIDLKFPISVEEVVLSGLLSEKRLYRSYTRRDRARARALLAQYGMEAYCRVPIGELSGGQRQRVFLCRAVISSPRVLILDEPVTYVDNQFETEFYALLQELNRSMAVVMVSHDLGTICSHVKTIACVNETLHYHDSPRISADQLKQYNCPMELITHGTVPHRVLLNHDK